jgi:uncharacterized protein YggT (Ycf19 family)
MGFIDLLLDLAGLLLWLNWRTGRFDPLARTSVSSLAGTLRRAGPRRLKRWHFLAGLAALLLLRALLYWQLGSAVNWTPNLRLGAIVLAFRSDFFGRMLLFSILSFAVVLAVFYLALLLLSILHGHAGEPNPFQKLLRVHLGRIDRWPWPIKLLLPLLAALSCWLLLSFPLANLNIIPPALSPRHRLEQALVIGLGSYLTWKYLVGVLLALYVLSSYVYLGSHFFWDFINETGGCLLAPLRFIPLRLGKMDFAPLIAIAVVFFAAEFAERGLTLLYARLPW